MEYQVTMLTVSQPIPTGIGGTKAYSPWSNSSYPINFSNPQLSTVRIVDDDAKFESGIYTPTENQQTLVNDTTFGFGSQSQTLAAGTQMSNFIGSVIKDQHGDEFFVVFPRSLASGSLGTQVGGKTSVFVFPKPVEDSEGEVTFPVFSLSNSYTFVRQQQINNVEDGVPYAPSEVVCFAKGTIIDTIFGPRAIETLVAGDMIRTRDNGMRWLSWLGHTTLSRADLDLRPNLRPICIRAGALAPDVPRRDLTVSPQHRVLIRSQIAKELFGEIEVLVAAKHLLDLPGISVMTPDDGVTYWHLLFDGHEIVQSNGAWTESLFTGPQALKSVSDAARQEIFSLFPQLAEPDHVPVGARTLLSGREGRKLARRHAGKTRKLVEDA